MTPNAVAWDDRVRLVTGSVVLGGAPWRVLRIAPAGRDFVHRLRSAGPAGLVPAAGVERSLADLLTVRGVVHPVIAPAPVAPGTVAVVVPVYEQPESLDACLAALRDTAPGVLVVVVDDASSSPEVSRVARAHGATLLRHPVNRGPAAARNTGVREVRAPLVAFVDADCTVTPGWLERLVGHFADPRVAAVAPRIAARPPDGAGGPLVAYQLGRSSLDMGERPQLVTHGAPLGYLPSAALLVRRSAGPEFDERMRVGEDVDLIWRLVDDGHLVRYEPAAVVTHEMRTDPRRWAARIFDYGTSAAELDRRHPGRLAPARLSGWNAATAALVLCGWPWAAFGTTAVAAGLLARTLRAASVDARVAPAIVGKGLLSDAEATGHLLRREWWPVGWLALALAPRSTAARAAAAAMLVPPVRDWLARQPDLDVPRYLGLRLLEDAAYGSGVILSAVRSRRPRVLLPAVRLPWTRRRGSGATR